MTTTVAEPPTPTPGPRASRVGGLLVAAATLTLMLATEPRLSIVWDEGQTLAREARIRAWARALRDPAAFAPTWHPPAVEPYFRDDLRPPRPDEVDTRAELFEPRQLIWFWPFGRAEPLGHPPFFAIVGMLGDLLTPSWAPLPRARLGPMVAFSLAAGALFSAGARRYGVWAGVLSAGAWALHPHLFALGHYATYDALLSALWVGSVLAFAHAARLDLGPPPATRNRSPRWGWVVAFGLLAGWAADTKLTGWFLPLPFVAWTLLYRDRRGVLTLLVGGAVALLTLYLFNPPWWTDLVGGVDRFFASNLSRAQTNPIKVLFLGQIIETPTGSLPWYNTLLWTALVTPVGFLAFALVGAFRTLARPKGQPFEILALGHWAFLLLLRALPHTPGHDGVRQFLPAFGCLALVAAPGAAWVVGRFGGWGKALVGAALVEGAISVALLMPVPLSYYSPLVGGLPGATKLGMEPTYFWDALNGDALDWLNVHTPAGRKVQFATFPSSWLYLRETGRLRPRVLPFEPGANAWYVLQNRPGSFRGPDRDLAARGRPAYVVEKFGVPLVWVFPSSEVERFRR